MIDLTIDIQQLEQVREMLAGSPEAIEAGTRAATELLRDLGVGATPVGVHPFGGALKRSWSAVQVEVSGRSFSFSTPLDYSQTLEEGLYPRVGPRTIAHQGGIYSRQAPGGILGPLLEERDIIDNVVSVVVDAILQGVQRRAGT